MSVWRPNKNMLCCYKRCSFKYQSSNHLVHLSIYFHHTILSVSSYPCSNYPIVGPVGYSNLLGNQPAISRWKPTRRCMLHRVPGGTGRTCDQRRRASNVIITLRFDWRRCGTPVCEALSAVAVMGPSSTPSQPVSARHHMRILEAHRWLMKRLTWVHLGPCRPERECRRPVLLSDVQ